MSKAGHSLSVNDNSESNNAIDEESEFCESASSSHKIKPLGTEEFEGEYIIIDQN
jgi:hypothetical protein